MVRIAEPWSPATVRLGLDQPLAVVPTPRPRDVAAAAPLDWMPDLARTLHEIDATGVKGDDRRLLPPLALSGPDGSRSTHAARQIARHSGLPFFEVDIFAPTFEAAAAASHRWTATRAKAFLPSPPVLALAASGRANPVLLVHGIERAGPEALATLVRMMDPAVARRWRDDVIEATIDLGAVTWMLRCTNPGLLPGGVPADLRTARIQPHRDMGALRAISVVEEALHDLQLPAGHPRALATTRWLANPQRRRLSTAELYRWAVADLSS